MTDASRASADVAHGLTPIHAPGREADLSSAVYGSLLVTTLLAVQARADASPQFVGLTLIIGVGVFWLTEVWSELVSRRVRGRITRAQVWHIARAESPMLSAAVIPGLILAGASTGIGTVEQGINLAMAVAIAQLFLWGLAVGRAINRGWPVALVVAVVDCALGLLIVTLKVFVLH